MTNYEGETRPQIVYLAPPKSVALAYVLLIFLGGLGVHNFYLRNNGAGVTQLLLTVFGWLTLPFVVGGILLFIVFVWLVVELFTTPSDVRRANYEPIR